MAQTKDKPGRIGTLKTAIDCRRELAKAYRQYRNGQIDDRTAKTSTYMLQALIGMIRDHDHEARMAAIEQVLEDRNYECR